MAFRLQDKDKLDDTQRAHVIERLGDFHRQNKERLDSGERPASANSLLREFREAGVSYKRQDMLDDVRRSEITYRAESIQAMNRAENFYDSVIEPIRQKYGVNQDDAFKIWNQLRQDDYQTLTDADFLEDIWDTYEAGAK